MHFLHQKCDFVNVKDHQLSVSAGLLPQTSYRGLTPGPHWGLLQTPCVWSPKNSLKIKFYV